MVSSFSCQDLGCYSDPAGKRLEQIPSLPPISAPWPPAGVHRELLLAEELMLPLKTAGREYRERGLLGRVVGIWHLPMHGSAMGFPGGHSDKELARYCRRLKRCGFDPRVGKKPWRRKWQLTPVFLPGKSLAQKSLVGYSSWGRKESDTT